MNKVILMGNIGQDPDLKYAQSGTAILNIRLATNERWKNQDGEWEDKTEWHSLIMFSKRAEGLAKHLSKGDKILATGRLQTRSWEKDGVKRYSTEVVVDDVEFCGGGNKGGGQRQQESGGDDFGNDDIPF